ncbi:MAG: hypothetical protein I4E98_09585 [Planktothrix agardhii KL2]|jgi:hypothetical protein|uniref:hypothetical protein n=1 Tax=Planktothrix agardhii TaxID=1160 RepID=UPI001A1AD94D|nr:hypothetical protein [Planktothrix agardhii]MBG0746831.1 hypothetical protein [Planktothrix agardhii KL2]
MLDQFNGFNRVVGISLISLSVTTILVASNQQNFATAQENPGCFIVDHAERVINLDGICVPQPQTANSSQSGSNNSNKTLTQEELAKAFDQTATLYADNYCEARAQGLTNREAGNKATSVVSEYMVLKNIPSDILSVEWIEKGQSISKVLCPELQPTTRYN